MERHRLLLRDDHKAGKPGEGKPGEGKPGEGGGKPAQAGPNTSADGSSDTTPALESADPKKPAAGKIDRSDNTVTN